MIVRFCWQKYLAIARTPNNTPACNIQADFSQNNRAPYNRESMVHQLLFLAVSSGVLRNSGPFLHILFPFNSATEVPLVGRSTGFWHVLKWRHCVRLLESCISPIRFATSGLKLRLGIPIHHNTFMLSLQNVSRLWSIFSTLAIDRTNLNPKTAPISWSLETLVADSGATLVLKATRPVDIVPSLYWYLE